MPDYLPMVIQILPLQDYHIQVMFDNGKLIEYDMNPLLEEEAFAPLKDHSLFSRTCMIMNGTLVWDITGMRDEESWIEIDPLILYECPAINEEFVYMGNTLIE